MLSSRHHPSVPIWLILPCSGLLVHIDSWLARRLVAQLFADRDGAPTSRTRPPTTPPDLSCTPLQTTLLVLWLGCGFLVVWRHIRGSVTTVTTLHVRMTDLNEIQPLRTASPGFTALSWKSMIPCIDAVCLRQPGVVSSSPAADHRRGTVNGDHRC